MIQQFFCNNQYKKISLQLSSEGYYSPRDSEWNYSDIPHLNFIHTRVEGVTLKTSKHHVSNIFLQRVGPFEFPASVNISHRSWDRHSYIMIILNIGIAVETTHGGTGEACKTTTRYDFFYKGLFGYLICLMARYSTRKNYQILMSEDMPMRIQRGELRRKGVTFALDKLDLIGFSDTIDVTANNIDCRSAVPQGAIYQFIVSSIPGSVEIENYWLRAEWSNSLMRIYPLICPHEGAPLRQKVKSLDSTADDCRVAACPWHGKKIKEVAKIDLRAGSDLEFTLYHTRFILSIDNWQIKEDGESTYLVTIRAKSPESGCEPLQQNNDRYDKHLNEYEA